MLVTGAGTISNRVMSAKERAQKFRGQVRRVLQNSSNEHKSKGVAVCVCVYMHTHAHAVTYLSVAF